MMPLEPKITDACEKPSWVAYGRDLVIRFIDDRRGTTAMEYGIIAALISVAIVTTVLAIGVTLRDNLYTVISNAITKAAGG